MEIKEFGHLAFNCRNQQRSVAFYRDILGCKEKFSLTYADMIVSVRNSGYKVPKFFYTFLEKRKDKVWLTYMETQDGVFLELFDQFGAVFSHRPQAFHTNFQHFALIVEDIHKTREELIAKGVKIDTDLSFGPDNTYQLWIHDPDGNKFEIMQYTDKSFQLVGRN